MHETLPEDQLAEVLVRGQQNGAPRVGLGHVDDVVAMLW
jgi:hypothetical protein